MAGGTRDIYGKPLTFSRPLAIFPTHDDTAIYTILVDDSTMKFTIYIHYIFIMFTTVTKT